MKALTNPFSLARTCVYWPSMEADVTDYIKWCVTCIDDARLPVETLHPHEVPLGPWVKVGIDFFTDDSSNKYFIIADYFSKFSYVYHVTSTNHVTMLKYLRELFSAEGMPSIMISDNGPSFNGDEFNWFAQEFDFVHSTSSPHFH